MVEQADVSLLVNEYRSLMTATDVNDTEGLEALLSEIADWSPEAASHLVKLADDYGSFMLRNALALALVLGCEDGKLGF